MIGIIGAGLMGKSIALELAYQGHEVKIMSADRHLNDEELKLEFGKTIARMKVENEEEIYGKVNIAHKYEDFSSCDIIIEALKEDIVTKRVHIAELVQVVKNSCIFCSNTSSLSIAEIYHDLVNYERVMGVHFFNPPYIMKLVELSTLDETTQDTIDSVVNFVKSINKESVFVKNTSGFVVNRLLIPFINEAAHLLDKKIATMEDIDKAMMLGANHPIGPFKLADLIGIDVILAILNTFNENGANLEVSSVFQKMINDKRLGRKTNIGFYDYTKKR